MTARQSETLTMSTLATPAIALIFFYPIIFRLLRTIFILLNPLSPNRQRFILFIIKLIMLLNVQVIMLNFLDNVLVSDLPIQTFRQLTNQILIHHLRSLHFNKIQLRHLILHQLVVLVLQLPKVNIHDLLVLLQLFLNQSVYHT